MDRSDNERSWAEYLKKLLLGGGTAAGWLREVESTLSRYWQPDLVVHHGGGKSIVIQLKQAFETDTALDVVVALPEHTSRAEGLEGPYLDQKVQTRQDLILAGLIVLNVSLASICATELRSRRR